MNVNLDLPSLLTKVLIQEDNSEGNEVNQQPRRIDFFPPVRDSNLGRSGQKDKSEKDLVDAYGQPLYAVVGKSKKKRNRREFGRVVYENVCFTDDFDQTFSTSIYYQNIAGLLPTYSNEEQPSLTSSSPQSTVSNEENDLYNSLSRDSQDLIDAQEPIYDSVDDDYDYVLSEPIYENPDKFFQEPSDVDRPPIMFNGPQDVSPIYLSKRRSFLYSSSPSQAYMKRSKSLDFAEVSTNGDKSYILNKQGLRMVVNEEGIKDHPMFFELESREEFAKKHNLGHLFSPSDKIISCKANSGKNDCSTTLESKTTQNVSLKRHTFRYHAKDWISPNGDKSFLLNKQGLRMVVNEDGIKDHPMLFGLVSREEFARKHNSGHLFTSSDEVNFSKTKDDYESSILDIKKNQNVHFKQPTKYYHGDGISPNGDKFFKLNNQGLRMVLNEDGIKDHPMLLRLESREQFAKNHNLKHLMGNSRSLSSNDITKLNLNSRARSTELCCRASSAGRKIARSLCLVKKAIRGRFFSSRD